ncbi:glycosyltransferase family 39 protein [Candidatus Omnitrophota bacterium]
MKAISPKSVSFFVICYVIILSLYLALALPKIDQPITDDEIYEVLNAENILAGKRIQLFIPPVYDMLLAGSIVVFGDEPWALRMPGIISACIALAAIMAMAGLISHNRRRVLSALAGLLLAVNPAFVQGSLMLHPDNTLLVPLILIWIYFLLKFCMNKSMSALALSGIFLTLSFLIKLPTPMLIAIVATLFVYKYKKEALPGYLVTILIAFAVFLAGWKALSLGMGLSFQQPYTLFLERLNMYLSQVGWKLWAKNLSILLVWVSPYLLLGILISIPKIFSKFSKEKSITDLFFLSMLIMSLYIVISAFNHGYPKYLMPGLAFFILVLIASVFQKEEGLPPITFFAVLTAAMTVYFLIFMKDPVYLLRYEIREALIMGHERIDIMKKFVLQGLVYLLPLFLYIFLRRVKPAATRAFSAGCFILILLLAQTFSLSLKQAYGDYQTNYDYGQRGSSELYDYLEEKEIKGTDTIIATKEIYYYLGRKDAYLSKNIWADKKRFLKLLENPRTSIVIVSIPSQTVAFYRNILFSKDADKYIKKHFNIKTIGTYSVLERKSVN